MKEKKLYETPLVKRTQIETESGFCAASVIDKDKKDGIKTEGHQQGVTIDASGWESDNGWK